MTGCHEDNKYSRPRRSALLLSPVFPPTRQFRPAVAGECQFDLQKLLDEGEGGLPGLGDASDNSEVIVRTAQHAAVAPEDSLSLSWRSGMREDDDAIGAFLRIPDRRQRARGQLDHGAAQIEAQRLLART